MDYIDNIYEAVYFFNRINCCVNNRVPKMIDEEEMKRLKINESIYKAIMRILVVSDLLDEDDDQYFVITAEQVEKHKYIMNRIINQSKSNHYHELFNKAIDENQFFFDSISELEYDIYSRCDFSITFNTGKEVAQYLNLTNQKVLELGGNSGGLATALLDRNKSCCYSIVDTKIPCEIGNEFKNLNKTDITFIEGNIFELTLPKQVYNYIIIMDVLHDFDEIGCHKILENCKNYCDDHTKFLIIEDILASEFEPVEAIMEGLRLSVECRGGKQRSKEELMNLFLNINYGLEKTIKLNNVHTMLVMSAL